MGFSRRLYLLCQVTRELIPLILEVERNKIREISIIYDGTTHVAEVLAVLRR